MLRWVSRKSAWQPKTPPIFDAGSRGSSDWLRVALIFGVIYQPGRFGLTSPSSPGEHARKRVPRPGDPSEFAAVEITEIVLRRFSRKRPAQHFGPLVTCCSCAENWKVLRVALIFGVIPPHAQIDDPSCCRPRA